MRGAQREGKGDRGRVGWEAARAGVLLGHCQQVQTPGRSSVGS